MPPATQQAEATPQKAPATETPLPGDGVKAEPARLRCSARGVTKSFGNTKILRGVDLEIPEGSFAVLVGPSGCGKSTLLRLVAGLEQADEGTITLADRDVTNLPPRDRDVAMVFQSYALYPHLTVRDNLEVRARAARRPRRAEIETRLEEASTMLGLDAAPRSPAEAALRWTAPARRDGPRHRAPADDLSLRRAALEPRCRAARRGARRDPAPPRSPEARRRST